MADSQMSREMWKSCLTTHYALLIDNLEVEDGYLLNDLLTKDILNWSQVQDLKSRPNRRKIAEGLVDMLTRINSSHYRTFFEILMKYQSDLAKTLGVAEYFPSLIQSSAKVAQDGNASREAVLGIGLPGNMSKQKQQEAGNIPELITNSNTIEEVMIHLSNPNLNFLDECTTIKAVIKWIVNKNLQNDKEITQLLNMMYFEWLSLRELQEILHSNSSIAHNQYVLLENTIQNIMKWCSEWSALSVQWGKPFDVSTCTRPRPGLPYLVFVGGTRGVTFIPTNTVDIFKATGERLEYNAANKKIPALTSPRKQAGMTYDSSGHVYMLGGHDGTSVSNSVLQMDTPSLEWKNLHPMQTARYNHMVCLTNMNIYVIGGIGANNEHLASVEVYDIDTKKWKTGTDYPIPISEGAATPYKGTCIAGGGLTSCGTATSNVYIFDLISQQWNLLTIMSQPRSGHIMAMVSDKIYIIGGRENPTAELFEPETDRLSFLTSPPQHKFSSNAVVYNDCIIVSHPTFGYDSRVYIFNTVSKQWGNFKVSLPCPKYRVYFPIPKTHLGLTFL